MKINREKLKQAKHDRRRSRVRAKISGTAERPRLVVSRSLSHMYAQIIDDINGKTLVAVHDTAITEKMTKTERAQKVGEMIGAQALKAGITSVVFDRSGHVYHGRIKAVAEGARNAGLQF